MRAVINGLGRHLPDRRLTNADLEALVETSDEWITTRTGIKERRILGAGIGTSHMAAAAARRALAHAGRETEEIDLIIVATVTPDMPVPATAAFVQQELKAGRCWGFDLNGGCSGFLYALATAVQFIESGRMKTVLVIGADKMSAVMDYRDRNTCVLFGDGAGAVVLEPGDAKGGVVDFDLHLDGEGWRHLYIEGGGSRHPASADTIANRMHYVSQDGRTVYKKAVTGMSRSIEALLTKHRLTGDDIRLLVPHQANYRIIDAVAKKLGISEDRVVINLDRYGNTTAATIPIALSEAFEDGRLKKGDSLVLASFGAGFAWGSFLLTWTLD